MAVVKARREAQAASGGDPFAGGAGPGRRGGPPTAAVLAGNVRADRQNLKMGELDTLFEEPKVRGNSKCSKIRFC